MSGGGSGYQERRAVTAVLLGPKGEKKGAVVYAERAGERDEERRHGVKVKSFKSDMRRKVKLRRATKRQSDAASGEISSLLTEPESSTLGVGKPDGMRSRRIPSVEGRAPRPST